MSKSSPRGSVSAPSADFSGDSPLARPPGQTQPQKTLSTSVPTVTPLQLCTQCGQRGDNTPTTLGTHRQLGHDPQPAGTAPPITHRSSTTGYATRVPPTSTGVTPSPSSTPPTISTEISSKVFPQKKALGEHPRPSFPRPAMRACHPRPISFQDVAEGSTVGDRSARSGAESSMKGHEGHTWTRR